MGKKDKSKSKRVSLDAHKKDTVAKLEAITHGTESKMVKTSRCGRSFLYQIYVDSSHGYTAHGCMIHYLGDSHPHNGKIQEEDANWALAQYGDTPTDGELMYAVTSHRERPRV